MFFISLPFRRCPQLMNLCGAPPDVSTYCSSLFINAKEEDNAGPDEKITRMFAIAHYIPVPSRASLPRVVMGLPI